jgi:uncharacterized membrane protein YphA (DoxX/SURF4 family)
MFPTGSAGAALVVLRSVVAITVFVDASTRWSLGPAPIVIGFVAAVGLCLLIGFLTPFCAAIACLMELALLVLPGGSNGLQLCMSALTAGAAAVLGPGAYSVDARIFGRKLITIPPGRKER